MMYETSNPAEVVEPVEESSPQVASPPEIRNLKRNSNGSVDLELNHPIFGWIPFTSTPDDTWGNAPEVWAAVLAWEGSIEDADPLPPAPPIVLPAEALFFDRMTDEEYDDLDASVRAGETARVYRGWAAAAVFEERTAMWELLVKHLDAIGTTPARRAELLALPSASAARAEAAAA